MHVLLANLKQFYQCRVLWLLYLFVAVNLLLLGGLGLRVHSLRGAAGGIEGTSFCWMGVICAVSLVVGAIVASLQMDVISRPFSFCLPDHRTSVRKLVLLVGLALSCFVLSLEFAKDSLWSPAPAYLFGVSLTAYFAGVGVGLMCRYGAAVAFSATLALLLGSAMLDLKESRGFVATTVSAVVAILLGMGSAVAVWQWLGETALFRRRCGKPWLLWDMGAREKYRWIAVSFRERRVPAGRAEGFLLGVTKRSQDGSIAKYIWGRLYTWLLPGAGGRLNLGLVSLFGLGSVALAWYMDGNPTIIALGAIPAGEILGHSPLHSSMLVVGGRRERFWATMASVLILGAILTLSATLAFEAMGLLGLHTYTESRYAGNPEFLKFLQDLERPMNLRFVVLLLALFPLSRLLEVMLRRRKGWMVFAQVHLALSIVLLSIFRRAWVMAIPVAYVVLAFILSWVLCTYGVYRTAMRSDLGRK